MYVHGWNDYFFQTHLADYWVGQGFDFFALELRRYGRNLVPGQFKGYITDLDDYALELDQAMAIIGMDHDSVTLMGHSTGGLVASLYLSQRRGTVDALVLNSAWLDLHGSDLVRAASGPVLTTLGTARPTALLPVRNNGFYHRSLDLAQGGEWTMEPDWKNATDFAPRIAWLAAIVAGHQRVARGLGIDVPILALASARSDFSRTWRDELRSADIVLDSNRISGAAVKLGSHVTVVRIEGGLHDLVLSAAPVREQVFAEITRWLGAYGPR